MANNNLRVPRVSMTDSKESQAFQREVRDNFEKLSKERLLQNITLPNITVTAAGTSVDHGLGRLPAGWFIVDRTSGTDTVIRSSWTDKSIVFTAAADVVVSIFVF